MYDNGDVDGTDPHATVTLVLPIDVEEIVGAIGTPSGVTVVVAAVALEDDEFDAITDTVYLWPLTNPLSVHDKPVDLHPALGGFVLTVYVNDSVPLKASGTDHDTVEVESPVLAATDLGGHGRPSADPEYNNRFGDCDARDVLNVIAHPVAFTRIQFHTCAGVALAFASKYNATTPATCGAAIDVPSR